MLGGRFLDVAIPVVPGVGTGVLGVVMIEIEPRQVLVQIPIVLDQFVIDTAIEGDDRRGAAGGSEPVGLAKHVGVVDTANVEEISGDDIVNVESG